MTDEQKQQYTLRISSANRTQLIVILYDILLDYMKEAEAAEGPETFAAAVRQARSCVRELSGSLNFAYAPSAELFSLYRYVDRELAKAQRRDRKEPLRDAQPVISQLREAFAQVAWQDTSPALMENAQTVYAGLTYGRGDLNLNLSDQGMDRGFRV